MAAPSTRNVTPLVGLSAQPTDIAQRGTVSGMTAGNGTSVAALAKPSGLAIGDVVLVALYLEHGSAPSIASTSDSWSLVHSIDMNADDWLYVWISKIGSASSTIGITWGGASVWRDAAAIGFVNVDATTQQDATATENTGNSATPTFTGITTVTNRAMLVGFGATFNSTRWSGWDSPAINETYDPAGGNIAIGLGIQETLGSTGNNVAATTSGQWAAIYVALRPVGGGGGPVEVDVDGAQAAASGRLLVSALPLKGAQPTATGALTVRRVFTNVSLAGSQPFATGRVRVSALRLVGSQPTATGTIAARVTFSHVSLAGDQPSATGTLTKALFELLAGAHPEATGALALRRLLSHVALTGNQPTATGRLLVSALRLSGAQPFATGTLVADEVLQHVALAGDQPSASGALAFEFIGAEEVDVAGNQPAATGTIARQLSLHISLAGAQPTGAGTLAQQQSLHIALAGNQPTATGTIDGELLAEDLDVLISDDYGTVARSYPRTFAWKSSSVGYHYRIKADSTLVVAKTTDGGQTWSDLLTVNDRIVAHVSIWADWWTSGNDGTVIHAWYVDTDFDVYYYRSLDTADDTQGTNESVVVGLTTVGTQWQTPTRSREGRLATVVNDTGTDFTEGLWTSDNDGDTWQERASPLEGDNDQYSLLPANLADPRDLWLIFWDISANELTLKTYDDSADTWGESSAFATSMFESITPQHSAAVRWSDGHAIVVCWTQFSASTSDLRCFDITDAGTITEMANVVTDTDTAFGASITIDQNTDDLYVFYLRGAADAAVDVFYKKSSDGGASWGSEVAYSQDPSRATNRLWTDHGSTKYRVGAVWPDETNTELWWNYTNSIQIAISLTLSGAQPAATGTIAAQRLLTHIALAGAQPSATGTTAGVTSRFIALAGSQPTATGRLRVSALRLQGAQPETSGALSVRLVLAHVALAGNQPNGTGALGVQTSGAVTLNGTQPAASGRLYTSSLPLRGNQPAAAGTLAVVTFRQVSLAGNQPSATGALRIISPARVAGDQPAASGRLYASRLTLRGNQPAASGDLIVFSLADAPGSAAMEDTLVYLAIMSDTLSAQATMSHELVSRAELVDSAAGAETAHELVYAGTMQESRP